MTIQYYDSPYGRLALGDCDGRLAICDWTDNTGSIRHAVLRRLNTGAIHTGTTELLELAAIQLNEYFRGQRHRFTIPLYTCGTEFQTLVWQELQTVNYGSTITYGTLALQCSRPGAVRAVANAVGANALSIFIPCHRIVAAHTPGGYAGGLETKLHLLALEQKVTFSKNII